MLEDSIPRADRIKTLSESSRSGTSTPTNSELSEFSLQANSLASNHARSRKQNIRELRDVFDDMPELYGIRRSGRSRKEPFRFQPRDSLTSTDRPRKRRDLDSSDDNDDANTSGSDADDQTVYWRSKHKNRSVRTRGNRVSYENAFKDDTSDGSDDGLSDLPKINRSLPSSQPTAFQKPKGPLIREPGSGFGARSGRKLNTESISPLGHSEDTQLSEDLDYAGCRPQAVNGGDEEDVDVIEEVLLHAVRRKGATGNPTTMYNVRLEKDLNADFDPAKEPGEMQFLIKWRNWSHIHSTWETEASLLSPERGCPVLGMKKFYAYQAALSERQQQMQYAERDDLDALAYEEERSEQVLNDKMQVERIVAHSRDPESNTFDYLIKWRRLDYRYCTWESGRVVRELYAPAIAAYETRRCSTKLPSNRSEALYSRPRFCPIDQQPPYLGCGQYTLRDYQLEGINWIARSWCRGNSVILADEMGLGKTIQTIGFLSYLFHEQHIYGPFLVVVPLSTVSSWQTELESWAPDLNAIIYTGDHISRQLIREHEWSVNSAGGSRRQQNLKFNVCITTYEILLKDKSWLSQVSWAFLGVDEAHRLKNDSSQLYRTLKLFTTNTRLLITGTPLQNTLKELWALLHFIMPEKFPDWEEFETAHSVVNGDDGDAFHNLHKVLRPFLLRRVKKDVESSLPEKLEQILRVDMSKEQANIYRLILARNYDGLMKVTRGHRASFINIVMELKKCCNHAHLIAPPSENEMRIMTNEERLRSLVRGSGKMNLLDKLLQRLKPKGHRVLIFSQMVRMLDLVADYLSLRGWGFQRLDGSIRGTMRKQALDHFNAEGSTDFCFLLSTRAGGLGINLATADTVVIFDSDWNPQNDLQAQARAHRIGQTKQVSVYRLVTQDSVEEKIIESATRKMVLDHLVIQRMDSGLSKPGGGRRVDSAKGQLLTEILRYGAEGLFQQQTTEDEVEQEVDIDDILMRAETRDTEASAEANPASALLASFKVTSLDTYEDDLDSVKPTAANTKTWDQIIPAEIRDQVKAEETQKSFVELELGPRRRKRVKAFQAGLDPCSSSDESSNGASANALSSKPAATQLSEKEIRALVRAIKRFARPLERLDAIAADAELPDRSEQELREVVEAVLKGCQAAMNQAESTDTTGKGPVFQYGRVAVAAKPLLHNLHYLETLHKCLPSGDKDARMAFRLPFSPKPVAWSCQWDPSDDVRLLTGVYEHGYDNWEAIKLDVDLGLGSKLLPVSPSERPQANHLRTRVDYLLKMLAKHHDQSNKGSAEPGRKRKHAESNKSGGHKRPRRSHKQQHSANILRPKSAEFVSDSDCESNGAGPEDAAVAVSLKRTTKAEPKKAKKEKNKQQKRREGDRSKDENRLSDSGLASLDNEEDFRRMRGPLFAKCKEKLLPIKKHFKHLERLEDADEEDTRMFSKVILRIGDHIHSVIADSQDRHFWKRYLWEFVQIFSKKTTAELRQIYRRAAKQRQNDDDVAGEQHHSHNRHNHHHHHHHHRHNSPATVAPALASPDHTDSKRHWHRSPPGRTHGQESSQPRHSGHDSGSRWGNSNHHFNRHKNLRDDSRFDNAFNRLPPSCGPYQPNHSESYRGNFHYPVSTTTTSTDALKRPDSPISRDPRLISSSFRR